MNSGVTNLQHHYSLLYQNAIWHPKMAFGWRGLVLQNAIMALWHTRLEMVLLGGILKLHQ